MKNMYFWAVKKIIILLLIAIQPILLYAQKTITVVSNIKVTYSDERGSYRWYRPVFAHEGSTLASDSADYNLGDNFFDAYGNVVITQPNGTVVYADKLHYTEATQQALLTGNVRLLDRDATLTTNYLTYNMKSKIGTYVGGGQIINGTDTVNSKNGYYFENSQDAYFRHDVIVKTPDVRIYTDTMRYNSGSKMTYFYGPTNIRGKTGNLYTENGDYNTETDYAQFGKNNLYTEGSKFLRGDSLLYDGKSGNGRAIKNVVFIDTSQHIVMHGQLGTYAKATQTTVMTQNAYIVLATRSDSTNQDTTRSETDSLSRNSSQQSDSLYTKTDSLNIQADSISRPTSNGTDSTYMTADTLLSQIIPLNTYKYANLKLNRDGGELLDDEENEDPLNEQDSNPQAQVERDSIQHPDSMATVNMAIQDKSVDSLNQQPEKIRKKEKKRKGLFGKKNRKNDKKPIDTLKAEMDTLSTQDLLKTDDQDSLSKTVPPDTLSMQLDTAQTTTIGLPSDTANMPKPGEADSLISLAKKTALANSGNMDSLSTDTTETRIVIAYHNVKIYKSDLQAIADSAYYGYPDSVIRCFGNPKIWSQGSQLTGDTVYLQLVNQKLDNMLLQNNAFIVNTQLDSSKFNQIKGRRISGFFTDGQLNRVFVDGNAESIYYTVEKDQFSGMARSISSRIKILFENNKMTDVISIKQFEDTYYPIGMIPDDQEFLDGFIWKPELRPKSKEEIIPTGDPSKKETIQKTEVENEKEMETKEKDKKIGPIDNVADDINQKTGKEKEGQETKIENTTSSPEPGTKTPLP